MENQLTYLWEERRITSHFTTGVSLHGHTNHSKESLYSIGQYAGKAALLRAGLAELDRWSQRANSIKLDFWKGYWTPPLPPLAAFNIERKQIEGDLGLNSLISLTDHDNIEAPLLMRVVPEARRIPVSLEWSVTFEDTVFHLGVHNLPTAEASVWVDRMAAYTAQPQPHQLHELLVAMSRIPQVLLVFNHPLWDLSHIGKARHISALRDMLSLANPFLHAFELGGLRGWKEKRDVIELAQAYGHPVIAGGDRHGCEPSALLNLTNARSFSEFVEEVRHGHSLVLAMPQYADCTSRRMYHTVLDIIRDYPDHPIGSRNWDERVYHPDAQGTLRPLHMLWNDPPLFLTQILNVLRLGEAEPVRRTLQLVLNRGPQIPRLELGGGQEATP